MQQHPDKTTVYHSLGTTLNLFNLSKHLIHPYQCQHKSESWHLIFDPSRLWHALVWKRSREAW